MREYLRSLAMAHYVVGGIRAFNACFGLIYCGLGVMLMMDPGSWGASGPGSSHGAPPAWLGVGFAIAGGAFTVLGWLFAFLTIHSGRCLARQQRRVYSIVVAAVNCIFFPFGTALGIITIILLCKNEVIALYSAPPAPALPLSPPPGAEPPSEPSLSS